MGKEFFPVIVCDHFGCRQLFTIACLWFYAKH